MLPIITRYKWLCMLSCYSRSIIIIHNLHDSVSSRPTRIASSVHSCTNASTALDRPTCDSYTMRVTPGFHHSVAVLPQLVDNQSAFWSRRPYVYGKMFPAFPFSRATATVATERKNGNGMVETMHDSRPTIGYKWVCSLNFLNSGKHFMFFNLVLAIRCTLFSFLSSGHNVR